MEPPRSSGNGRSAIATEGTPPRSFRVKGNIYLGTQHYFEQEVPGGLSQLYRNISDPALLAFIQQQFVTAGWYDVLPAAQLIRAEALALNLPVRRYLLLRSEFQAERDLKGVYRFLIRLAGAETLAMRLPGLFKQVFDFGSSDATLVEPGHVRGYVRDFPGVLSEWFTISIEAYATRVLRLSGVTNGVATSRKIDVRWEGGFEMASLEIDIRWTL